ncbi:hypothetical protein ACQ4PT_060278 [Festuca glaucescens]
MLLQVLVRLHCTRAAALTGALSCRWCGLWMHLTELSFRDIAPDALDVALNQVACPALSRLKIKIPKRHTIHPTRVTSLLGAAARLSPVDLVFKVWGHTKDSNIAIEIPCFNRATSIKLDVVNLYLLPPAGGVQFPVLERLSISGCRINIGKLIPHCPHLRVLEGLIIVLTSKFECQKPCLPNCSCDQPQNWRTQNIPLVALEEVEIEGFGGADQEVDFLKLLFRCATAMKRMTVGLAPWVFPASRGGRKMYSLFKAHPSVTCSVYRG